MSDDAFSGRRWKRTGEPPRGRGQDAAQLDAIFDVLSSRHRRDVLYVLAAQSDPVAERSQLVDAVRATEAGAGAAEPPSEERVAKDLHHRHLPRLVEAGLVEYDTRQGTVRYVGAPALEEWLERAKDSERRWDDADVP